MARSWKASAIRIRSSTIVSSPRASRCRWPTWTLRRPAGERPHGAPAAWQNFCGATWERTIEVLSEAGYRVIAPDQVGFCSSSKPGATSSASPSWRATQALLQQEGIDQISVIGHSMGGMLAARLALNYPQLAEQLVLVNPIGLEDWQAEGVPYAPSISFTGRAENRFRQHQGLPAEVLLQRQLEAGVRPLGRHVGRHVRRRGQSGWPGTRRRLRKWSSPSR